MSTLYYRIGQAASRLGTSRYHLRRLADEGLIRHRFTRTGQLLIPHSEIDHLEEEGVPPVPATAEPEDPVEAVEDETEAAPRPSPKDELLAAPSRTVISSAEKVLASRHKLEKMRIEEDMEHIKDSRRERREQKAALKAAEEGERRRLAQVQMDVQTRVEEQRRRRAWIDSWIESAIHRLPYGVPKQYHLDVRQHVEQALRELQPSQSYSLVSSLVSAASAKALEPHQRQQETERAAEEALRILDVGARSLFNQPAEWPIKAERDVRTALRALPQGATFQEKQASAKIAVHKINAEFEHSRICDRLVGQVTLWGGTDEERRAAKLAVEKALKALPVGSSSTEMDEVKNRTLKPFDEAIEKRKRQKGKQEQIEERIDESPNYIQAYLEELDSEDELEFDGTRDLKAWVYELRDAIGSKLRKELERQELSDMQFERLIERLVDEEL